MIALTRTPIDVIAVQRTVAHDDHGGLAIFIGTTRGDDPAGTVAALDYDAYETLAVAELRRVATDAADRHGALVAIVHRLGRVAAGEASVVVAASAPHRAEAFAACREGIDRLKVTVPIWKCTIFADGRRAWDPGAPVAERGAPR